MAKTPKNTTKGVDLSKLLPTLQELGESEDSCLGKEYDINTTECRTCADNALCLAFYRGVIQDKIKVLLPDAPLLDVADFSLITDEIQQKLVMLIVKYQEEGNPMKIIEVFNLAKQKSNCPDDRSVAEWVKRFLMDNNLITHEGNILKR